MAVSVWHLERQQARRLERRLKEGVPAQWAGSVERLQHQSGAAIPVWRKSSAWIERLESFRADHGDALAWAMSDSAICDKADAVAAEVGELMALWPAGLTEPERLDVVRIVCEAVGVAPPVAVTAAGAINRGLSPVWWRRVLRKKVARVVEHGAIKLGLVNKSVGGYASNDAVERRIQQERRNAAMLKKTLLRNEAGQVYTLAELAEKSVANRDVRRGELMTRIRGCEEYADASGHLGLFLTLTCPSRFHAMLAPAKKGGRARHNPAYEGYSPRDAQHWLRDTWARTRAQLGRLGVAIYGFRVAEPHHDGCPHWHALLWVEGEAQAQRLQEVVTAQWLKDGGDEKGAQANRVNIKRMERGGAAGYIAKYIAKNVGGSLDLMHMDGTGGPQADAFPVESGAVQGWQRVDAWAATWGIRQFQAIGQPPVSVWREMRRVTLDQVESLRTDGEPLAWKAWGACQRQGALLACWRRFVDAMGGMCQGRSGYAIRPAVRKVESVNQYAEAVARNVTVGLEMPSGRWLVSRRQAWARVTEGRQDAASRAGRHGPWTGFNNCTARITRGLLNAFKGLNARGEPAWLG